MKTTNEFILSYLQEPKSQRIAYAIYQKSQLYNKDAIVTILGVVFDEEVAKKVTEELQKKLDSLPQLIRDLKNHLLLFGFDTTLLIDLLSILDTAVEISYQQTTLFG